MKSLLLKHPPVWAAFLILTGAVLGASISVYVAAEEKANSIAVAIQGEVPGASKLTYGASPALANAEFFKTVRSTFIAEKKSFVEANLSEMKLRVYENGTVIKEVPILTKGRIGSWWETPAGVYKADAKYPDHFSSLGKVHLPWSIPFQGNFFIHGWPYYPDGTPVSTKYSGGCIRLSTEDAKVVYDLIKVGEPILVYAHTFDQDSFAYQTRVPTISATSYLAADLKNNYVFLSRSQSDVRPIASLTKLMTALVATEYINLERTITVTSEMIVKTSKPRLIPGTKLSTYDLLFPLLMESSNEAAVALAKMLGQNYFVSLMNTKAKTLGMTHSVFVDPSGAGDGNISTTEDLFNLAKYLYANRKFILEVSDGRVTNNAYGESAFPDVQNFNIFDRDPEFVGGKVGQTTAAKETIMSIFEIEIGGEKRPIVFIALGSENNGKDVEAMKRYVETTFSGQSLSGEAVR
ncbi:MAG: L,D-transpeptidase family protein [Patescibacteria group bacterium]